MAKAQFTDEAIAKGAKALALALHGGNWDETDEGPADYTAEHKAMWEARVRAVVNEQAPS